MSVSVRRNRKDSDYFLARLISAGMNRLAAALMVFSERLLHFFSGGVLVETKLIYLSRNRLTGDFFYDFV